MEFVWILTEYGACGRETVEKFLAGPKMRALLSNHKKRLDEIMYSFGRNTETEVMHSKGTNTIDQS